MQRTTFDQLDSKILTMLSENARKPYLEIARECGVSGAAVHQRIQRLMASGVIKRSECIIDPGAVGYDTCAYVGIYLRDPSQYQAVIEKLMSTPEVVECHYTSGQYDIFIKIFAHNNDHLLTLLQENIQSLGLARTETLISFKEIFKRQVPVNTESEEK